MGTSIEWTEDTWNPLRGCRRISPGCGGARGEGGCYAEVMAARINRMNGEASPYQGLVQIGKQGPRWTGATGGPDKLDAPLRWRKGRRIFPCSMSDLFYEGHPFGSIAAVFGVMAACPQHTFQVLTKRPERMAKWFEWVERKGREVMGPIDLCTILARNHMDDISDAKPGTRWPLPNVWIGVSVEDQQRADERLPHLLRTPAVVRWVSYEPALEAVEFRPWLKGECHTPHPDDYMTPCLRCGAGAGQPCHRIDWLVVGGESGHGARPFDLAWARQAVAQCKAAGVPAFVKQLGANPVWGDGDSPGLGGRKRIACITEPATICQTPNRCAHIGHCAEGATIFDRKGGDIDEFPADLRVREWPAPKIEIRRIP